jgi:arginase
VAAHRSRRARHRRARRRGLPQPGGLTWDQLTDLTATALATDGCAGWSVCIYNPDLDPCRDGADAIISYITQAITVSDQQVR